MEAVDPYSPQSAIVAGQGVVWVDVTPSGSAATPILKADPHRLWFTVLAPSLSAGGALIAPWADRTDLGWQITGTNLPTLIHNASYPGMVTLPWYIFGGGGTSFRVVWYSTRDT